MRRDLLARTVAGAAFMVTGAAAATGLLIARALTAPYGGRRFGTRVHGTAFVGGQPSVLLDDSAENRQAGPYGAFLPDGGYVGFGSEALLHGDFVARAVSDKAAQRLSRVERVSWTGIRFPTPASAGLDAQDVLIETALGPIPAWRIDSGDSDVWAVHVHGLGSTRAGTLRGVQVTAELGISSLIVTYRNAAEGIRYRSGRPTLGLDEADDVEKALEYAVDQGARRIVLVGWSMGASMALELAHRSRWRHYVIGIVADSPVLDWRAVLVANLKLAGMPVWSARLAYPWLTWSGPARLIGLDRPIDLEALDWTAPGRIEFPMLILQGTGDRSVPWQMAARAAEGNPRIELELFEADHTTGWNSDPQRWCNSVTEWLTSLLNRRDSM